MLLSVDQNGDVVVPSPIPEVSGQAIPGMPGYTAAQGGYRDPDGVLHSWGSAEGQALLAKLQPSETGGGSGGGGDTTKSSAPTPDPSTYLGVYGLPPDVQAKIDSIFQNTADVNQASQLALSYIRGTSWYAQTYPGIQAGIEKGIVSNEASYRAYVNDINQLTQQYYGRAPTSDEISGYLTLGYNPSHVGNLFQGQAFISANRNELQYLSGAFGGGQMNQQQLTALGNEQAGIDSPTGQLQQKIIQRAQQVRDRLFGGSLANPSLSLGTAGVYAPTLNGTRQLNANNNPDIHS